MSQDKMWSTNFVALAERYKTAEHVAVRNSLLGHEKMPFQRYNLNFSVLSTNYVVVHQFFLLHCQKIMWSYTK